MNPLAIERATIAAWPAAVTEEHHGWFYLASGGVTGRVNAAWPLLWRGGDVEAAIDHVEDWYAARALAPRFKLTDGAIAPDDLPARLTARGYGPHMETLVMTRALTPSLKMGAHENVELFPRLPPVFAEVIAETSKTEEERLERLGIAERAPASCAFALFPGASGADAIGMSAIAGDDADLAGIFLMRTKPAARRQGAARQIVEALLAWAANRGAGASFLQVEADNAPAIALYRGVGFATLTRYSYWRRVSQPSG